MRRLIFLFVIIAMATLFPPAASAKNGVPTSSAASKGEPIRIFLEARPSETCFPASALQEAELLEDFSDVCEACEFIRDSNKAVDFSVVVEDPGLSWRLSIYDRSGRLVKKLSWSGCLRHGLTKATDLMLEELLSSRH